MDNKEREQLREEISHLSYNEAMKRLEDIVARMQADDCDIDSLSRYTATALILLQACKERLTKTDEEIKNCLAELS